MTGGISDRTGKDHPRSRGEYWPVPLDSSRHDGSSPLSRGIPQRPSSVRSSAGIIPALAGNTTAAARERFPTADHPRSRGEYDGGDAGRQDTVGSSPLSRGIHRGPAPLDPTARIIPALAGNTTGIASSRDSTSDHPRSRGEYDDAHGKTAAQKGSSPLSRGIRRVGRLRHDRRRIIPALAGNTAADSSGMAGARDHPRSRGEYLKG